MNQRYRAWLDETGQTVEQAAGRGYKYTEWIAVKWSEYMAETGAKRPFSDAVHADFTRWIMMGAKQ